MAAGVFFTSGEAKARAGVYQRYEQVKSGAYTGASDGVVAMVLQASWGELEAVIELTSAAQAEKLFGSSSIASEAFLGGARKVYAVRVGTGGTKATATLKDSATTPVDAVVLTAKHPGTRALSYVVRAVLGDATKKELVILEGTKQLEKFQFTAGTGEASALVAAAAHAEYIDVALASGYAGTDALAAVASTAFTVGTDPTVATADYSTALLKLETYSWNTVCVDTNDTAVHALLSAFVQRIYQDGVTGIAVIGEPTSITLSTRMANAAAFNSYQVVYAGLSWKNSAGTLVDGCKAAARLAGMIAATTSDKSITHVVIPDAVEPGERLTNAQYDTAISSGAVMASAAPSGAVWLDSGITTLVTPANEDDNGWKKIKRVKVRFELMSRIAATVAPLIGRINNDSPGRATVIQNIQGVLNAMVAETKLAVGASVAHDTANIASGDSAWFVINADDVDSLEKCYLTYKFRFAAE